MRFPAGPAFPEPRSIPAYRMGGKISERRPMPARPFAGNEGASAEGSTPRVCFGVPHRDPALDSSFEWVIA